MDCQRRPLNPDFMLNDARYRRARMLLTCEKFGCGSSREHGVWALDGDGIRATIARSFADIFRSSCMRNGLPATHRSLGCGSDHPVRRGIGVPLRSQIDLQAQSVQGWGRQVFHFQIDAGAKPRLLHYLDDIVLNPRRGEGNLSAETRCKIQEPWIFR
jgi:3-isopropylmalate/(R)-2-methylmalate dehydratase small subunit